MKITIVGGGNIGTQFMVHCAAKKHEVTAYTSDPGLFSTHLRIVDDLGNTTLEGDIACATNDPERAFADADFIMVTLPATMMRGIAKTVFEYGSPDAVIGVVPGNGGSECAFKDCIERKNTFFAIERVPAVARLVEKGKTVRSFGYRDVLNIASIPSARAEECCKLVESIYGICCRKIPNLLNLTLTPSNPILHTTRLKTIFCDYKPGVVYKKLPLFYQDWDDASSELLFACDREVQDICKALPEFHLEYVRSLKVHYESPTVSEMTGKISGIPSFAGLTTPSVAVEGGFIPDLHSRYFTADFSYGLSIIKQVARFAGVKTPNIDQTLLWYDGIRVETGGFSYSDYAINTKSDLERFYLR